MSNITRRNFLAACGGTVGAFGALSAASMLVGCDSSGSTPLVVGYSPFSSKFSPFFAETAYDQDACAMTQISLYTNDRLGNIIYKGIDGETNEYNGTDYKYNGAADIDVVENDDGTVDYNIQLKEGIKFSDGEPVTIDDFIFSLYTVLDPTFDGSATLYSSPIKGLEDYRSGMDTLANLIIAAGEDNKDFDNWTEEQQTTFWENAKAASEAIAQEIVDYCGANGYNDEGDVAASAGNWGFDPDAAETIEDFAAQMMEAYGNDIAALVSTENAGSAIEDVFPNWSDYIVGVSTGDSADHIEGIVKTGDYSCTITATEVDAAMIYSLGIYISPLHYYGDKEQYDYDNNKFGFTKGDLSIARAKISEPMGAGPYKFVKFENGVINYEANDSYFLGGPKIKYVNFREMQDVDKLNGVVTGTVDVTDPSWSKDTAEAVSKENGGELSGSVITTSLVDNLGYGYIAMNSHNVCVNDKPDSDESKDFRKGFATIFSVYRDVAVDSYYGDGAIVVNYPISSTSWAAPQPTDDGYKVAFSVDVDGNDIFTSDMDADAKYAAAKEAALGFFEAAGCTVKDGKVTKAAKGAKLEYECMIPADGTGDHPAFMILTESKKALEDIGIKLIINDLSNSSDLWTALEAQTCEMWCAAWGSSLDPDLTQVYYSDIANGGENAGGSNYMYQLEDADLDDLIFESRHSIDQEYRKQVFFACFDKILDWAVEVPTYQRSNAIIFSTERVNIDSVTPDITTFYGWMNEIQNMRMK